MSEPVKVRYCYSHDGETYFGEFNTREDAFDSAVAELDGADEPGQALTVWVGIKQPAMHFLRQGAKQIGIDFVERVDDWLSDEIAADNPIVNVRDPDAFGAALVVLIEEHATFTGSAVIDIKKHEVGKSEAPNCSLLKVDSVSNRKLSTPEDSPWYTGKRAGK